MNINTHQLAKILDSNEADLFTVHDIADYLFPGEEYKTDRAIFFARSTQAVARKAERTLRETNRALEAAGPIPSLDTRSVFW